MDAAVLKWIAGQLWSEGYDVIARNRIKRLQVQACMDDLVMGAVGNPAAPGGARFDVAKLVDKDLVEKLAGELMVAPYVLRRTKERHSALNATVHRVELTVIEDSRE